MQLRDSRFCPTDLVLAQIVEGLRQIGFVALEYDRSGILGVLWVVPTEEVADLC